MLQIISKGIILLSGQQKMTSSIKTFAVTLSAEMAPTATVVVYDLARSTEVVADSLTFPVDGISRDRVRLHTNVANGCCDVPACQSVERHLIGWLYQKDVTEPRCFSSST